MRTDGLERFVGRDTAEATRRGVALAPALARYATDKLARETAAKSDKKGQQNPERAREWAWPLPNAESQHSWALLNSRWRWHLLRGVARGVTAAYQCASVTGCETLAAPSMKGGRALR